MFSSSTTGEYNFTLYYFGNPEDVCVLYLKNNITGQTSASRFVVVKTTNVLNDSPSVTGVYQSNSASAYVAYDLDEAGNLIFDASAEAYACYRVYTNILNMQRMDSIKNSGKLPLVHLMFGTHYCKHLFLTPNADMVPRGGVVGNLIMPEIEVGSRTFINFAYWGSDDNTSSNNSSVSISNSSYFNLGLVEV